MAVTTISYFRFDGWSGRIWAFVQMGLARRKLSATPRIEFWKLFGTGSGHGFTLWPNTGLWAILATWPDLETARAQVNKSLVFRSFRRKSDEDYTVFLDPVSCRGEWDDQLPFAVEVQPDALPKPLAVLTRATVKPHRALKFWKRAPAVSDTIGENDDVVFKAGMGELPGVQQVTFSIWPDMATMSRFAYRSPAHTKAIRAVREGAVFKEELYARFAVLGTEGSWLGGDPVAAHLVKAAAQNAADSPETVRAEGA
ncbi:MAG: spheroidene monooxygenase [Pseudomonadota bacterium]